MGGLSISNAVFLWYIFVTFFLKFLALLVIGNEILIHVPVLCK